MDCDGLAVYHVPCSRRVAGSSLPQAHGRRLGGTGGTVPQNLRWGTDGPCIRPSNILRSSVIGCVAKYELTKSVLEEFLSEIEVFRQEKEWEGETVKTGKKAKDRQNTKR